ncbi:reverse transcriptase domain-containing protein, partial [Acinetobacter baumannii]|uniref:reverse transcriptase domain-containing protein n=1 Tax=Acinetobacter baumannii TaxID=470 RepID=UPI003393719A
MLLHYGITVEYVRLIKQLYESSSCQVVHNGKLSDPFTVKTRERQGRLLSPMIFLIVVDWVMRHTTENAETGLKWTVTNRLEDLYFADDISLLSHSQQHAQSKLARLAEVAGQVGLKINVNKTEVLRTNIQNDGPIQLQGHSIRETDRFLYLG